MDWHELLNTALAAIIGFALAQVVNIGRLGFEWFKRPRLAISEPSKGSVILSHTAEVGGGAYLEEKKFGFYVDNIGRTIATGVRFQLLKIEIWDEKSSEYEKVSDQTFELSPYDQRTKTNEKTLVTLVPHGRLIVGLATWREDYWAIMPLIDRIPDYFEEICGSAKRYRFSVVVFDDKGNSDNKEIEIRLDD